MSPSRLQNEQISGSRRTGSTATLGGVSARARRRAIATRGALSVLSASALLMLLILPLKVASPVVADASAVAGPATAALDAIDVTTVSIAVAVVAAVALLRKLPYGIGVVIACTVGAVVTGELVREAAASSVSSTGLPYGRLVATAALLAAASLVASAAWRPVVLGVGTVATLVVAAAALITGAASTLGAVTALLVVFVWWPACSIVMLYSPDAAAREARNPLDTAALVVQRKTGHSR